MEATARKTNSPSFSTAYYFLEGLNELGIEYLFCNFGTDHAPIIEAMAHRRKARREGAERHRSARTRTPPPTWRWATRSVTGRGQGVLVHVDVGTANTANAMHNLFRSRLPVLLMSGKAPYTSSNELVGSRDTYVHFVQEPIDQGALVRPYMKWEWTLPSGVVVKEALRRAHTIMESEPQGPVYFMVQRETLTQKWSERPDPQLSAPSSSRSRSAGGADPALIVAACRPAARRRAADPDLRLCRPQSQNAPKLIEELASSPASRCSKATRPSTSRTSSRASSATRRTSICRRPTSACWSTSTCRGSRPTCTHNDELVLGAHRRRHAQVGVADVDVPGQPAHAGRQRPHPRAGARRAEEEGDAEVQGGGGGSASRRSPPSATPGASAPRSSPPTRASRARSIRTTCSPSSNKLLEARRHRVQRGRAQRRRLPAAARRGRCRTPACAPAAAGSAGPAAWRSAPSSRRPTG